MRTGAPPCGETGHQRQLTLKGGRGGWWRAEEEQTPAIRVQMVIELTRQKRKPKIWRGDKQILDGKTVRDILADWKHNHESWMNAWSQETWRSKGSKAHVYERSRFKTFLFQMVGCEPLVKFWLHVQASWDTLRIFHSVYSQCSHLSNDDKIKQAVDLVREECEHSDTADAVRR